ncbi:peptidase domain-containing ABC transporter [Microvirga thermotolerans]|uniref:ATP-binding cassette domain-containing protein n=1 Tax=Microvirga thermotolerans TaxID=2651334 RepID=A0A5P9K2L3_9HYPH|nr:peptidase domain-containing ABC transporter [Microvirga thermotolerans]QFU17875.1 ATP-binding cassette domain-containing protein [Microvirga thermotolerans]
MSFEHQTGLHCLVAVARHHGTDLSVEQLAHAYAVDDEPVSLHLMRRIAQEAGLRAREVRASWSDLLRLEGAFPAIAELQNGNWVVVAGIQCEQDGDKALILDPKAVLPEPLVLTETDFCKAWSGRLLLIKPARLRLKDGKRPFGFLWFAPELLRQRRLFGDVIAAALVLYALGLAVPIFSQLVIDKVLMHESYATLYVLAGGVALALVFDAVFTFLRRYLLLYATNRIDIRVAVRTFAHLLSLPLGYFERVPAGVLVKHMQQANRIREFLTGRLFTTALDSFSLFVFLPVLLLYSVKLTIVVLAFTACVGIAVALLIGPFRRRLQALYEAEGERQALLVESVHGMRTVKSLALEPLQRRSWDNSSAQAVMMRYDVDRISAAAQSLTGLLEKLMSVAIIALGAIDVFDREMTVGALVAFNMLAGRVSGPLVQILTMAHEYQEVALSVRMLGEVMNRVPESDGIQRGLCPPLKGSIQFEDVSFSYQPERPPALDGVSFSVEPGTIVGIVGRSGSGKTTITRLIQRLYPVQNGLVRIDGHDIRELDLVHLRKCVGVVLQDNFLFRGTVRENIAAAKPSATFEEIARAAKAAGAEEFIARLPRGFDTMLEENAANLSGGQRQRLAIARALVADPRLLILDEATSALDPDSEMIVRQNLRRIAEGRTVLIVSHRLSTLVDAHAILVVERGRLIAMGRHDQLLSSCTTYRQLWNQQTRHAA